MKEAKTVERIIRTGVETGLLMASMSFAPQLAETTSASTLASQPLREQAYTYVMPDNFFTQQQQSVALQLERVRDALNQAEVHITVSPQNPQNCGLLCEPGGRKIFHEKTEEKRKEKPKPSFLATVTTWMSQHTDQEIPAALLLLLGVLGFRFVRKKVEAEKQFRQNVANSLDNIGERVVFEDGTVIEVSPLSLKKSEAPDAA